MKEETNSDHEYQQLENYENEQHIKDLEQLRALLQSRAAELFRLCDAEEKGFINKKDIQRMREPLGLTPDLLEEVFDTLDAEKNGFLTLDEFTRGFSSYLGAQWDGVGSNSTANNAACSLPIEQSDSIVSHSISSSSAGSGSAELVDEELENESMFRDTMESLGAAGLIEGESNVKDLWLRLRHEDPNLLRNFEDFIGNVCQELRRSKHDFSALESVLQSKSSTYDENVKKLYEEMEEQIKAEKNLILAQEKKRERELKEKLERDLKEKEKMLQDSLSRQVDMEQKLLKLNHLEFQQKQENERLLKEKQSLEEKLQESFKNLEESKSYINTLVEQTNKEKRKRARKSLRTIENIALERENLAKELEMLKEMNKKLQDERDEIQIQTNNVIEKEQATKTKAYRRRPNSLKLEMSESGFEPVQMSEAYSEDDTSLLSSVNLQHLQIKIDSEYDESYQAGQDQKQLTETTKTVSLRREQPIGTDSVSHYSDLLNVPPNATPQRVFKIVFIGDSGVGKTSFMQRFCNDKFCESFSTTIGVDFQVRSMMIDNRVIALQVCDTAGQERFRSITKQYFRKADGVICMYDIISEQSFKNLKNWITFIKECVSDECVLAIIGNKIDLCENDDSRVIKYKDGAKLADDYGALFFETSSKESRHVFETMEAIARILQEKEDKQIEDVLNLKEKSKEKDNKELVKKKGCCS